MLFIVASDIINPDMITHLIVRAGNEADAREIAESSGRSAFGPDERVSVVPLESSGPDGVLAEFSLPN